MEKGTRNPNDRRVCRPEPSATLFETIRVPVISKPRLVVCDRHFIIQPRTLKACPTIYGHSLTMPGHTFRPPSKVRPRFFCWPPRMRLFTKGQQVAILKATCHFFKMQTNFRIDPPSSTGPCGSSIRIITGEEEGLFGWLRQLSHGRVHRPSAGPGRARVSRHGRRFHPDHFRRGLAERENLDNSLVGVMLRLLGRKEIIHKAFVTTWDTERTRVKNDTSRRP